MNILIISDAWLPQTNGVVRTLQNTRRELQALGHQVKIVSPQQFLTVPCPTYKEIRLAIGFLKSKLHRIIESFQPQHIHIATEGPLGLAGRAYCLKHGKAFTTSFHTKFPDYLEARFGFPSAWSYKMLHWFHTAAQQTMVATPSLKNELEQRHFEHMVYWTRGVDTDLFKPADKAFLDLPRPVFLFVGRVAVEKNIAAFLRLDLPGSKCVVGSGPLLKTLKRQYPEVHFPGAKQGAELAHYFAAADVFVFPSLTDTFGLVMLEALAAGIPVAAFPVTGPRDVVTDPKIGVLDQDLQKAALHALGLDPADCRRHAEQYSWAACTRQFLGNLVPT